MINENCETRDILWVPEKVLIAVDLPLRRSSQPDMIRRWR
jgi:hypothetical protein